MSLTTHEIGFEGLDAITQADSLCLFISEDERPLKGVAGFVDWRLCGGLSRLLVEKFFTGAPAECLLLPSELRVPMPRIFAVGVGPAKALTAGQLGEVLASAARMLTRAKAVGVALEVPGAGVLEDSVRASALVDRFVPEYRGSIAVLSDKGLRHLLGAR